MTRQRRNLTQVYREIGAGGFSQVDGSVEFYTRLNALLRPDMTVLDYGAGRGSQMEDPGSPFRAALVTLRGKVGRIVGVDVDDAVLQNPHLDEAKVVGLRAALPFPDGTFDMIFADWVLEHVDTPELFAQEVTRLLRPGGWFCARTPNRWGMTGIATNLVPNRLHAALLRKLQPGRQERDVFPTAYRLNTRAQIGRHFPARLWEDYSYHHNPEPAYLQGSRIALTAARVYLAVTPRALGTNLHVFLRRRDS